MDAQLLLQVVPASIQHAFHLAPHLREADIQEVRAASGARPLRALVEGIKSSKEAWTVLYRGEPIFIFGVVSLGQTGAVWALGSDLVSEVRKPFLRQSKFWLDWISRDFKWVGNLIDSRNTLHIRWLKWLGFTFCEPHFRNGHEFLRFSKCVTPPPCSPRRRA